MFALCMLLDRHQTFGLKERNTVLLFDSEQDADAWLLMKLVAAGIAIQHPGGRWQLDGEDWATDSSAELLERWQFLLDGCEYAHVCEVMDMRAAAAVEETADDHHGEDLGW